MMLSPADTMLRLRAMQDDDDARSDRCRDDVELVAAVRRAEPRAVEALYDRVRPVIDRTLARLLGVHDADFDDMVQNSLIELVRSVGSYRGEGSLDGWVATLSARVVYRHIRARRAERLVFDAAMPNDMIVADAADVEAESAARELIARIRAHLGAIDEAKAWTYLLHDVYGYSLAEIAEITGVSVAAAQSRLVRGRRALEERLADDPELATALGGKR